MRLDWSLTAAVTAQGPDPYSFSPSAYPWIPDGSQPFLFGLPYCSLPDTSRCSDLPLLDSSIVLPLFSNIPWCSLQYTSQVSFCICAYSDTPQHCVSSFRTFFHIPRLCLLYAHSMPLCPMFPSMLRVLFQVDALRFECYSLYFVVFDFARRRASI